MHKQAFLDLLRKRLADLPHDEIEERIGFYSEMIDDRMEEGLTEEEAVASLDSVEAIVSQTVAQTDARPKKQRKTWVIVLLVLGSPLWLSLAVAAVAVLVSLYAALWSVILALWTVFVALTICAVIVTVTGAVALVTKKYLPALALLGAGLILIGLSVFSFFGCCGATKAAAWLTKLPFRRK